MILLGRVNRIFDSPADGLHWLVVCVQKGWMDTDAQDLARLREHIDQAAISGLDKLPPEPKLGEALGLSRGRLRTLLKRMEEEGLIWRHVGKGTFVGQRGLAPDDRKWADSISVDDVMDARLALEPQLAAQAAMHANAADLAAMDQCLEEMVDTSTFLNWKRLDEKLHRLVAQATHNMLLLRLYETLRAQVKVNLDARMHEVFSDFSGPKNSTNCEHNELVQAIRIHNPEKAEQSMRRHIVSVRRLLFGIR